MPQGRVVGPRLDVMSLELSAPQPTALARVVVSNKDRGSPLDVAPVGVMFGPAWWIVLLGRMQGFVRLTAFVSFLFGSF